MTDPRKKAFEGVAAVCPSNPFNDSGNILALHNLLDAFGAPREIPAVNIKAGPATALTERMLLEILEHEGIVCEAYKDSVGVWTWSGGITDKSGHKVGRYKDKPSTLEYALEVFEWLLRTKYLPEVLKAFSGFALNEAQLAAAVSFHWNTGGIGTADWVRLFRSGKLVEARAAFMNWSKPVSIIPRRKAEQKLFFDGIWSGDGIITVYAEVSKPSYAPKWSSAKQVDVRAQVRAIMERAAA